MIALVLKPKPKISKIVAMSNLSIFTFEKHSVRCIGTDDKPEWIAADIFNILGVKWDGHNLDSYDDDEKGRVTIPTPGGKQEALTITEFGLYRTLFKSRKGIAKRFQRWVFHDVIPSIRKTGSYSIESSTPIAKLPSQKERLETIQLGIDLFQRLGGCDERTELLLKDHIRNILLEEKLQPALPGRVEYPVSDRALVLGYRPTSTQLCQIGKQAARIYQQCHGQKPVQREQFVAGTTRMVNVYSEADVDILDQAIALVMTT